MDKFMAKSYLASLNKSGFGSLGPTDENWKGIFNRFDKVEKGKGLAPNKPIPEYLVDKNALLFESSKFEGNFYSLLKKSYNPDVWLFLPGIEIMYCSYLRSFFPEEYKENKDGVKCYYFECHKSFFVMPHVLRAAEPPNPFDCIKQEEG
ncbi:hypothetical protein DAPPUDRAFT_321622 [Daphnia pulex]|uniref:Uncharacterized protein n=1 Tax=Daphnia pulex TaxID=6669 RepID=E9GT76_DAPPU|nr:hypothetical protein DAPPUDRAFT_321622 [Daphnia pulex]|eukprot:EFX77320.1 hypothetical protein DAPPUDRAFT_321622 [Daphnia pulex]